MLVECLLLATTADQCRQIPECGFSACAMPVGVSCVGLTPCLLIDCDTVC